MMSLPRNIGPNHLYRVTVFRFRSADRYTGVHSPTVQKIMNQWKLCRIHPIFCLDTTFLGG